MITKYELCYNRLIDRAKRRKLDCYSEWHHIIPRSLGGCDEKSNLVQLTYREHFLAHWLLTKYITGKGRRSMVYALQCMGTMDPSGQRFVSAWQYEVARRTIKEHFEGVRLQEMLAAMKAEREKLQVLYNKMFIADEAKAALEVMKPTKRILVKRRGKLKPGEMKRKPIFVLTFDDVKSEVGKLDLGSAADRAALNKLTNRFMRKPFNQKFQ